MKLTQQQCAANISVSIVQGFNKIAKEARTILTEGIEAKGDNGQSLMQLEPASIKEALGENLPTVEAAIALILKDE